jgi:hypothetical protein
MCWDCRATPEEVRWWIERLKANPLDDAKQFLQEVGDPSLADTLREYLGASETPILQRVVRALGWSGDASDQARLSPLLNHPEEIVRTRAGESITDLGAPGAAALLWSAYVGLDPSTSEAARLLEGLIWLRHPECLPIVRKLLETDGLTGRLGKSTVAHALAALGDASDRALMAEAAVASLEKAAADGYVKRRWERSVSWVAYTQALAEIAPDEIRETRASLSDAAALALTWYPEVVPEPLAGTPLPSIERNIGRRSIVGYSDQPLAPDGTPPAKFFGQPDWRDEPAWPVGGDGQLLMFYGQLPVAGDSSQTAYLFTAGPEEWTALGPGSAVVIQPGNTCHLPTRATATGPQSFDWEYDTTRFVRRARRVPQAERYVQFEEQRDPSLWTLETSTEATEADWNKVGGTALWLQFDETPEAGNWNFAFQFEAARAGSERGDGAIFYGWTDDDGAGALGWQCS